MSTSLAEMLRLTAIECPDATYRPDSNPLVFASALGSQVRDVDGKEYIDLCAGFGALPFGHNSMALRSVCARYGVEGYALTL